MAENFERIIRERAYQIWEAEGRPMGRDREHWLRAEAEVKGSLAAPDPATKKPAARKTSAVRKPAAGKKAAAAAPKPAKPRTAKRGTAAT